MNREEIKEHIEIDFDETTKEILSDETIIINPTANKDFDFDSDEDNVDKTKNISWIQIADALICEISSAQQFVQ